MITQPEVEENPTRLPGTCFSCGGGYGTAGRKWFLDTDVDYFDTPTYRIQICNICFDLLANTCGYIKMGEEVERYRKEIDGLKEEINELDKYRRLGSMLGLSSECLDRFLAISEIPVGEVVSDDVHVSNPWRTREEQITRELGGGEKGSAGSSDDERVAELRPTQGNLGIKL